MVRPMVHKIQRFPESPCVSVMVRLILQLLATKHFGKEGTSQGGSRVVFFSSFPAFCNFADSVALEIGCGLSSTRT